MSYDDDADNPYSSVSPTLDGETPEIEEAIRYAIRSELMRMRVSLPAVVSSTSNQSGEYTPQMVSVQPMVKVRNADNTLENLPVIQDVPVVWPMGLDYGLRMPTAVGDVGTLLFSDRALDSFVASNGQSPVDPQDTRIHDYTDPQFFPGLFPVSKQQADKSMDVVLFNGNTQIRLTKDGKVAVKNQTVELLDQLSQLVGQIASLAGDLSSANAMVVIPPSPTPAPFPLDPVTIASATQVQATAQQIQQAINTLKA